MRLKEARKQAGLTAKEVSNTLGVSVQNVFNWESGLYLPPTKRLPEIAKLYGCTVDELLRDARQSDTSKGGWNNATENAGRY